MNARQFGVAFRDDPVTLGYREAHFRRMVELAERLVDLRRQFAANVPAQAGRGVKWSATYHVRKAERELQVARAMLEGLLEGARP